MPAPSPLRPTDAELRRLYVDERWSAQRIGEQAKVSKKTALVWLRAAGIERRPIGSRVSLAARGITPPTAAELDEMMHVKHMPYREIAALYGVDFTAVPHWVKKHGLTTPKVWATRRKGHAPAIPPTEELAARYRGGESMTSIARMVGVDSSTIRSRLVKHGVEIRRDGWEGGKRYACADGHEARSTYEQKVDDWLHERGLPHELEPAYPWDRRYRADFKVGDAYIEVWGVTDNEAYKKRKAMKIARCKDAGLRLIQINWWQFSQSRRWWRPLLPLVQEISQPALLPAPEDLRADLA